MPILPLHHGQNRRSASVKAAELLRRGSKELSTEYQLLIVVLVGFSVVLFGSFIFIPDTSDQIRQRALAHSEEHAGVFYDENLEVNLPQQHPDDTFRHQAKPLEEGHNRDPVFVDDSHHRPAVEEHHNPPPQAHNPPIQHHNPPPAPPQHRQEQQPPLQHVEVPKPPKNPPNSAPISGIETIQINSDKGKASPQSQARQDFVREMMKHAWSNYERYAWGENELQPISHKGHSAGIFGKSHMGATIVDAVDTLKIMGLDAEYQKARDWIDQNLSFHVATSVSVFEVTIRFIGGLLSTYGLTGDDMYKRKAVDIADRLLPAFNTKTGLPKAVINLATGATHNWGWASGGSSILSEFGTMQLEFDYLSKITGNPIYAQKADAVMKYVLEKPRPNPGLVPNYLHPDTGKWGHSESSLGALGDSFYEYVLKIWVYNGGMRHGDKEGRKHFDEIMESVKQHLVQRSPSGYTYVADWKSNRVVQKMGHLACFVGGLFAIASKNAPTTEWSNWYLNVAKEITDTCHRGYSNSVTGLGPEAMMFSSNQELTNRNSKERYYILRPEVVESYFVLWRVTHDQKYRDYAWEAVEAIEKNCRVEGGYSGLKDVSKFPPQHDDVQQSFFLAETLKYLYLIFSEDDVISLDEYVFNTEAHPIPIQSD